MGSKIAFVVTFERLNPVFLGCYGTFGAQTTEFDRLASESLVFDQHFGENFASDRLTDAWWTGTYTFPFSLEQQQRLPSFLTELRRRGVWTQLIGVPDEVSGWATASQLFERVEVLPVGVKEEQQVDGVVEAVQRCLKTLPADRSALVWLALEGLPRECSEWKDERAEGSAESGKEGKLGQEAAQEQGSNSLDGLPEQGSLSPSQNVNAAEEELLPGEKNDVWTPAGRLALQRLLDAFKQPEQIHKIIRAVDRLIGRLRGIMSSLEDVKRLLWVVAAAGGLELPTAARFRGFDLLLNESVVRGLQLVWLPTQPELRGRLQTLVQTVDLGPTLLEWFDAADAWGRLGRFRGRSWLPLLRGENVRWRDFLCLGMGQEELAIRTADYYLVTTHWQLVEAPQTEISQQEGAAAPPEEQASSPASLCSSDQAEATDRSSGPPPLPPEPTSPKQTNVAVDEFEQFVEAVHDDPVALAELMEQAGKYCRLFVKPDDVWNIHDVAAQAPEDVLRLRMLLRRFMLDASQTVDTPPQAGE